MWASSSSWMGRLWGFCKADWSRPNLITRTTYELGDGFIVSFACWLELLRRALSRLGPKTCNAWLSDLLANCLLAASFRLTACAERRDIGIENLGSSL